MQEASHPTFILQRGPRCTMFILVCENTQLARHSYNHHGVPTSENGKDLPHTHLRMFSTETAGEQSGSWAVRKVASTLDTEAEASSG